MKRNRKQRIHIDLETFSPVDIGESGVYRYAEEATIYMLSYKIGDGETKIWYPILGEPMPNDLLEALENFDYELAAHNAEFERTLLNSEAGKRIGIKSEWIRWERWVCTMAKALMCGLPGSLDKCSKALGLIQEKDKIGSKLMKQLCTVQTHKAPKPLKSGKPSSRVFDPVGKIVLSVDGDITTYYADPTHKSNRELLYRVGDYCIQDTNVEYAIDEELPDLPPSERKVWSVDKQINERGIAVDLEAINKAVDFAGRYANDLSEEFLAITGFNPTQNEVFKNWCIENGLLLENTQSEHIKLVLSATQGLAKHVKRAISIRQSLNKASTKKYAKILGAVCKDGRIHGMLEYHGAATGRWAGKIVQMQNLTKESKAMPQEQVLRYLKSLSYEEYRLAYGDIYESLKRCLRGVFVAAPGKRFFVADLAQIEARMIAFLAGDDEKIEAFREGKDLYKLAASGIYSLLEGRTIKPENINKTQRTIGKVAELALGFQGGAGAFLSMGKIYGVYVPDADAQSIVDAWREANPKIVAMWKSVFNAAKDAVEKGGTHYANMCQFRVCGKFLCIKLPSGRLLYYYKPRIEEELVTIISGERAGESFKAKQMTYLGVKQETGKSIKTYCKINTHGGKLVENIVQAAARDVLAQAIVEYEDNGDCPVLSVHDEVILEVFEEKALNYGYYHDILCKEPEWAKGLPLNSDKWYGWRYNK